VICAAEEEAIAHEATSAIHERLMSLDAVLLGPAPLFRLRRRFRSQLMIKATARQDAIDAVGAAVAAVGPGAARAGASVSVDVDPQ
jgi:primosomal protein N'